MFNKINIVILGLVFVFKCAYSQIDTSFCDINSFEPYKPEVPFPQFAYAPRYQAFIEKNDVLLSTTDEILEVYDGVDDIGVSVETIFGSRLLTYAYGRVNELLVIDGPKCAVYPLDQYDGLSNFNLVTINNTKRLLSPLGLLLVSPNLNLVFQGPSSIRGMPVNEWKTCIFSEKAKATLKITLSFSSPTWDVAFPIPDQTNPNKIVPIPVQLLVESKDNTGKLNTDTYSVYDFKPLITEYPEALFPPNGIYCPGRKNVKDLPKIPNAFFFESQTIEYVTNELSNVGLIKTIAEQYDYDARLYTINYNYNNQVIYEIHDFATGIKYRIERETGICSISKLEALDTLDENTLNGLIYMKDPLDFFDFSNVPYQYVGEKKIGDINSDIWIGPKVYLGVNSTWEWAFMAQGWNISELGGVRQFNPVQLNIRLEVPVKDNNTGQIVMIPKQYKSNFYAFNERPITPFIFDLSTCDEQLEKNFFIFSFPGGDYAQAMRINEGAVRRAIHKKIMDTVKITAIRINKIDLSFSRNGIYVVFTLYEKSKFYGPVDNPVANELSSTDAISILKSTFESKNFKISFKGTDDRVYEATANENSFTEIDSRDEGYIYVTHQVTKKNGYSSGAVAAVTIILTLVGLSLGFLLIVLHKMKKINLPFLRLFYKD